MKQLNTFVPAFRTMEHHFELPVDYKGETLTFTGRLVTFAYDYKFFVNVYGCEIVYEQDDEQQLRAIAYNNPDDKQIDAGLIVQIAQQLEALRTTMSI